MSVTLFNLGLSSTCADEVNARYILHRRFATTTADSFYIVQETTKIFFPLSRYIYVNDTV